MGLFSWGRGRSSGKVTEEEEQQSQSRPPTGPPPLTWASNAPDGWPVLVSPALPAPGGMANPVNVIFFSARLVDAFGSTEGRLKVAGLAQSRLEAEGVLEIPVVVSDSGRPVPVFAYPDASAQSAGHFAQARAVLEACGETTPVYFAPEPLPAAAPAGALRAFNPNLLNRRKEPLPPGHYAMWWSTQDDPDPRTSPCMASITRAYEALDRVETYALGALLRGVGAIKEPSRVALPPGGSTLALSGPEGVPLVMSTSAEKGIGFHFAKDTTPARYRDAFCKLFAEFAADCRQQITGQGLPLDPEAEDRPAAWWRLSQATIAQAADRGEAIHEVGTIAVEPRASGG